MTYPPDRSKHFWKRWLYLHSLSLKNSKCPDSKFVVICWLNSCSSQMLLSLGKTKWLKKGQARTERGIWYSFSMKFPHCGPLHEQRLHQRIIMMEQNRSMQIYTTNFFQYSIVISSSDKIVFPQENHQDYSSSIQKQWHFEFDRNWRVTLWNFFWMDFSFWIKIALGNQLKNLLRPRC